MIGYAALIAFLFGSAFSQNFQTIIITRFLGGGASSVTINKVGGTITDIWKGPAQRSLPI
ncbi:hypothetical protein V1505DRAFT_377618 [Lipomyces doorenjongii]